MEDVSILSVIPLMGILFLGNIAIWIRMKTLRYSRKRTILGLIIGNAAFLAVIIYGIVSNIIDK